MKKTTNQAHSKAIEEMMQSFGEGAYPVTLPPPAFVDMEAEILDYQKNKSIQVSFPVIKKQTNPMGVMQGGYIAAAFDNAFGPLSFLIAKKPTVTIDMNIQYIRSVATEQTVVVVAKLEAKGFTTMHMTAEMRTEYGKILATATTNLLILKISSGERK